MPESMNNRGRISLLAIFAVVCGFILGVRDALSRELWFDEALTAGEFMHLPTIAAIYRNYVIPNNHIVYTIFLKFWNQLYPGNLSLDMFWRLFTVLTAAATITLIFLRWRKRYGILAVALVLSAFCYSLPFGIYATAIRGYMLSMLWIVLALECARIWTFRPGRRAGTGYFLFSLLAVGTIPSNLLALGGIVIFFFPYFGFKKVFNWKFIYLAVTPLLATTVFYLPISSRAAGILELREGWQESLAVLRVVYSSFAVTFFPLIVAAAAGGIIYFRRRNKQKFLWPLLIPLIPVMVVFLRSPAPFPRIFVTLWPLWILLLCAGLRHFTAHCRMSKKHLFAAGFLLAASFGWGIFWHNNSALARRVFHGMQHLDDFFNPYYMSPEHKPWTLVQQVKKVSGEDKTPVFVTFNAEPCVIVLYGRMAGIEPRRWLFDKPSPRGKVLYLPPGTWILVKTAELKTGKLKSIEKRFGIQTKPLFQSGTYAVFQSF